MRGNNSLSIIDDMFDVNPFNLFNSFNSIWSDARARMDELMNDPETQVYKSPDGSTTICYNTKTYNNGRCINTRAKKEIVANDYPITDVYTDEKGDFNAVVLVPGYGKDQVYVDFKNNYLNVFATKNGAWKDILVKSDDGITYEAPKTSEKDVGKREIKNYTYIQKQAKDWPVEEQHILVDTTRYDIKRLEKTLENGVLKIYIPAKEETKPALLTFND